MEEQKAMMYKVQIENKYYHASYPTDQFESTEIVYVDDIVAFSKNFSLVDTSEKWHKFQRNENGEIQHSAEHFSQKSYNVQEENVVVLSQNHVKRQNVELTIPGGYEDMTFHFAELEFTIRWIENGNKRYKLVKPYGTGVCEKHVFNTGDISWYDLDISEEGFLRVYSNGEIHYSNPSVASDFSNEELISLVWFLVEEQETSNDIDFFKIDDAAWLTDKE